VFHFTYFYGIPVLNIGVSLQIDVVAALNVGFGYQFLFYGNAIGATLSSTQFRASAVPGGSVSASITAGVDVWVARGGISATVTLISLDFPVTAAIMMDGSSSCYKVSMNSQFLRGNVVLYYEIPHFCYWSWCHKSYELFKWDGLSYTTDFITAPCCQGSRTKSSIPELTHYKHALPPSDSHQGQKRITYFDGSPQRINSGRTVIHYEVIEKDFWTECNRITLAKSTITGQTVLDNLNQVSAAADGITNALKECEPSYKTLGYNAGHIVKPNLGGSNSDLPNFFLQLSVVNSGSFEAFEIVLRECLRQDRTLEAEFTMRFEYFSSTPRTIIPKAYEVFVKWRKLDINNNYIAEDQFMTIRDLPGIPLKLLKYPTVCQNVAHIREYIAVWDSHMWSRWTN